MNRGPTLIQFIHLLFQSFNRFKFVLKPRKNTAHSVTPSLPHLRSSSRINLLPGICHCSPYKTFLSVNSGTLSFLPQENSLLSETPIHNVLPTLHRFPPHGSHASACACGHHQLRLYHYRSQYCVFHPGHLRYQDWQPSSRVKVSFF